MFGHGVGRTLGLFTEGLFIWMEAVTQPNLRRLCPVFNRRENKNKGKGLSHFRRIFQQGSALILKEKQLKLFLNDFHVWYIIYESSCHGFSCILELHGFLEHPSTMVPLSWRSCRIFAVGFCLHGSFIVAPP